MAAFAVDKLISFGKEAITLAASAEGVQRAFAKIGSPELLDGLRTATKGTVTDLVLMQNAVKANNFQIPLEQLGKLFAFAQSRARATGESVDYLVDSIISLQMGSVPVSILPTNQVSIVSDSIVSELAVPVLLSRYKKLSSNSWIDNLDPFSFLSVSEYVDINLYIKIIM